MGRLKRNVMKPTGRDLTDEEFAEIEKGYMETGKTGKTPRKKIIEACKKSPDTIISYESETTPFPEYIEKLQNGEFDR